jgi:hypothetical protein
MNVALHTSALAATADEIVFLPWLKRVTAHAAQHRQPTAVLVPLRADAYALKARALSAGLGLFGVHFLTPGEMRDRLAQHLGKDLRVPLREHLRLLLATAAERVNERRGDEATASVAASPDQLLKAIDLIGGGGWPFAEAGPMRLRPVVAEFQRLLETAGFDLVHDADRALLESSRTAGPLFANLFVTHFNALHWPHWPLLESAVRLSAQTSVCLTHPRFETEALDTAWIGSWEQTFGSSAEIPADTATTSTRPEFLVGENTSEQARAIVTKTLQYLAEPDCERLGVLFPAAGALARRVAELLAQLDIPHHDGLAHHAPGPLEDAAWPAWLAFQENPRLPTLLTFLRAQPEQPFAGLPFAEVADRLTRTFQELLFDDLTTLGAYLTEHPRRTTDPALADALLALPLLPTKAPLGDFIKRTDQILRGLGWSIRADEMHRLAADWESTHPLAISRRSWLRWLGETLVSWRVTRATAGRHPYSRLHLLPYAQAESQSWTHLILAGLNEGQWPPPLEDAGYLGEEEIDALNRRLAALNTRVTAQGVQGEGHLAVQPGKAFCLGVAERRALARRQFLNTLESATVAVTATASLVDEATPDRPLNPSEFFNHLHFETHRRAASQDTLAAFRTETARWLDASKLWLAPAPDLAPARPTRHAYDARRTGTAAFGEFEFAMRTPPSEPLHLSATQWEAALSSPALVWMNVLLGVGPGESSDETPWNLTTGQWSHHWLAAISDAPQRGAFAPLPTPGELSRRVLARARAFRERVAAILAGQRRELPDWWQSAWEQAWRLTAQFSERVAAVRDHTAIATERTLPDTAIALPGDRKLHLRGRTDLLLAGTAPSPEAAPEKVWIVDYKTGKKSPLAPKRIAIGDGLQLALYALAWRELGAREVGASILTPSLELPGPQVTWSDLAGLANLWDGLYAMQQTAVFGQLGALRDEWSFGGDYPLATLAIDPEVLDEKWALTHTAFAAADEEESA